jgi:MoxR-like ATPase
VEGGFSLGTSEELVIAGGAGMNGKVIKVNNKLVQLSQPYQAQVREMVGREKEITTIQVSWMAGNGRMPLAPLLVGECGIGKNRTVYEVCTRCGKELYLSQAHEDITAEDLMCAVRFSDDPKRKMDYILSPLATAMIRGMVFFIDGLGKMRKRALDPLESVLDERRYLDITTIGERIHAHPGFRFVAATNPSDMEDEPLADFIRSRIDPIIPFGYPTQNEINQILQSGFPSLRNNGKPLLDCFWRMWKKKNGDIPPAPRDSNKILAYAQSLADWEAGEAISLEHHKAPSPIKPPHIEQAFDVFYGNQQRGL